MKLQNLEDGVPQYRLQSAAFELQALPTEVGTAERRLSMVPENADIVATDLETALAIGKTVN